MKLKSLFIFSILLSLIGCLSDPIDLSNSVDCKPENFVGTWKYHSTNGVKQDSIADIVISISDDLSFGDLFIHGTYHFVKSSVGCTTGDLNGILDQSYELKNSSELIKRTSLFLFFGSTELFVRK
jgi:hypothetical protein